MYLFILGRQPEISLAEIASVFGVGHVHEISRDVAAVDADVVTDFPLERLGSIIKVARVFGEAADFSADYLAEIIINHLPNDGKLTLGLSSYNRAIASAKLAQIEAKIRAEHRGGFREIPRPRGENTLNSASVLHNKLTGSSTRKAEIILAGHYVAQTVYVQNITSYTFRDRDRPRRDARVGMLPPKLAQTIINLAIGSKRDLGGRILLDPFCGTGVVLQEFALMGGAVYGTDIEPRMIDYTRENLDWLSRKFGRELGDNRDFTRQIAVGDATNFQWSKFDFAASETYLGQPYATDPPETKLRENINTCDHIIREFLVNLAKQADDQTGICVAVPCWKVRGKTTHLPLIRELEKLGFTQMNALKNLVYRRDDQIVGRELLMLRMSPKGRRRMNG